MIRLSCIWLLVLSACGDPSLDVVIDVPDGYEDDVASVTLRVLEPPVADPFDCDDVAFRVKDAETVDLAAVVEVSLRGSSGSTQLGEIPRVGDKLLLAEGFDADSELMTAGCTAIGTIHEDEQVLVTMEPATLAEVPSLPIDTAFPPTIPVAVSDGNGDRLAGIATRWLVIGPQGETIDGEDTTNNNGVAAVRPGAVALAGPQLLELRVRWFRGTPPILNAFGAPTLVPEGRQMDNTFPVPSSCTDCTPGVALVSDPRAAIQVGKVGPGTDPELGFAALGPIDPINGTRMLSIYYFEDETRTLRTPNTSLELPRDTLAIGLIPGGPNGRDRIVTTRDTDWFEFSLDAGGNVVETDIGDNPFGFMRRAERIVSIADCDGGPANHILVQYSGGAASVYDPDTSFARVPTHPFTMDSRLVDIIESGCVSDTDGNLLRAVAFDPTRNADCEPGEIDKQNCPIAPVILAVDTGAAAPLRIEVFGAEDAVGFARPQAPGDPNLFLSHRLSFAGQGVGKWQLNMQAAGGPDLELVETDITVFAPLFTQGGDFDGDGQLDVGAFVVLGGGQLQSRRILMSLAAEHRGEPIMGVDNEANAVTPYLRVLDFDQDGFDDALLTDASGFGVAFFGELNR